MEASMSDETLTLNVPEALAKELGAASKDFVVDLLQRGLRDVKIERALRRYTEGGMSFTAAARMAGIHQSDLARHAYARGMQPPFSEQTLAEELA
jgi:hypothetical protein